LVSPAWLVRDTMLHEIAHAFHYEMTGEADHGEGWREIYKQIGGSGRQTFNGHKELVKI